MGLGIDVFAGLRGDLAVKRGRGRAKGGAKVSVVFRSPALVFRPDEKLIATTLASAMAAKFREYLLSGRWLDGRPLPAVAPATVIRRKYRLMQVERGGAPLVSSRRVLRKDTRERKRLEKRYASKKLGTKYPTAELSGMGVLGLESGTMAQFSVGPVPGGMGLFVPDVRGRIDRRGTSPWLLLVQRMGGVGRMDGLMRTPSLIAARGRAWWSCFLLDGARMISSRDFRRAGRNLQRLGSELVQAGENLAQVAERVEEISEADGG